MQDQRGVTSIRFSLKKLKNDTFVAMFGDGRAGGNSSYEHEIYLRHHQPPEDDTGALYYVVAVIFIYGFSIILMIASSVKKDKTDHGLSVYMNDMDKVKKLEKREMKIQVRMAMQQTAVKNPTLFRKASDASLLLGKIDHDTPWDNSDYLPTSGLMPDPTQSTSSSPSSLAWCKIDKSCPDIRQLGVVPENTSLRNDVTSFSYEDVALGATGGDFVDPATLSACTYTLESETNTSPRRTPSPGCSLATLAEVDEEKVKY